MSLSHLNFPAIGSPRAVGSKFGDTSGTSQDVIYPVSRLVDEAAQEGRTVEFNWKSDSHRFWTPRNTRLYTEWEVMYGEVQETCSDVEEGPQDNKLAPPSRNLRMTAMPGAALFDGQARFVHNNVTVETTNNLYDQSMATLLTTSNIEGTNTSGSNMLTSLRKDSGTADGLMFGQQADNPGANGDGFSLMPVVTAPYTEEAGDTRKKLAASDKFQPDCPAAAEVVLDDFVLGAAGAKDDNIATIVLPSVELEAQSLAQKLYKLNKGAHLTLTCKTLNDGAGDTDEKCFYESYGHEATSSGTQEFASIGKAVFKPNAVRTNTFKGTKVHLYLDHKFRKAVGAIAANTFKIETPPAGVLGGVLREDQEIQTVGNVANTLAVKVKSNAHKDTTPNPKVMALQASYNKVSKISFVQCSEPLMLSTWQHNYGIGPSSMSLFLTIGANYLKDLFYDPSGQYGCPGRSGAAERHGSVRPGGLNMGTVSVALKSAALHISYVHPVEPYIPKSISIKTHPIQVAVRTLRSQTVQETFVVPSSTRSLLVFLKQDIHHLCADRELDGQAKAGAGVNALGTTNDTSGTFAYDSRPFMIANGDDAQIDPRHPSANSVGGEGILNSIVSNEIDGAKLEHTAPMCFEQLQCQLGQAIVPREALSNMKPPRGEVSRAWNLFTEFVSKSHGFRGSAMSYADFTGYLNHNYNSGPRCGDRGCFFMFNIQNPSGTLSTDCQIRGILEAAPHSDAKQQLVVMAISESMYDIAWQAPSESPVLTRIQPLS